MARSSLSPGMTIELARVIQLPWIIVTQIGEVDAARIAEADHDQGLAGGRYPARDERIRGVDDRHALEVDVGLGELRADDMHVGVHAAQDRVGDGFGRVAARGAVAMDLLDPFEIDDGHDADLEVGVAGDVDLVRLHGAVQALVEQKVASLRRSRASR